MPESVKIAIIGGGRLSEQEMASLVAQIQASSHIPIQVVPEAHIPPHVHSLLLDFPHPHPLLVELPSGPSPIEQIMEVVKKTQLADFAKLEAKVNDTLQSHQPKFTARDFRRQAKQRPPKTK